MSRKSVSEPTDIVIPVHGALEYLRNCVSTLIEHTSSLNRIIFVDDASDLETTAYMLDQLRNHKSFLYIRSEKQRWFTRTVNLGLRLVRTQRVVIMNSDCVVDRGWLEELYDVWADAEKLGMRVGLVGSVLSGEEPRRWVESKEPGYVTAHCWLCSMGALYNISARRGQPGIFLDETQNSTIHIRSDVIGCYEMNRAGYATIQSHKSAVGHIAGKSWGHNLAAIAGLKVGDPLKGEVC